MANRRSVCFSALPVRALRSQQLHARAYPRLLSPARKRFLAGVVLVFTPIYVYMCPTATYGIYPYMCMGIYPYMCIYVSYCYILLYMSLPDLSLLYMCPHARTYLALMR